MPRAIHGFVALLTSNFLVDLEGDVGNVHLPVWLLPDLSVMPRFGHREAVRGAHAGRHLLAVAHARVHVHLVVLERLLVDVPERALGALLGQRLFLVLLQVLHEVVEVLRHHPARRKDLAQNKSVKEKNKQAKKAVKQKIIGKKYFLNNK